MCLCVMLGYRHAMVEAVRVLLFSVYLVFNSEQHSKMWNVVVSVCCLHVLLCRQCKINLHKLRIILIFFMCFCMQLQRGWC